MNHFVSEKKVPGIMLVILFTVLSQFMSFCQEKKASGQKEQEKTQSLTPSQTATVKSILSKYNPSALTATDARAIHEKLRDAGLHAGPETRDVLVSAGFDPEKLKALDPPKNKEEGNKQSPPSEEERMKTIQEKVIKPLGFGARQNETLIKAFKEFFAAMESMKKEQVDPRAPLDKLKVDPLEKSRDEKIRQTLSAEQYSKYQELERASRPPKPVSGQNKN